MEAREGARWEPAWDFGEHPSLLKKSLSERPWTKMAAKRGQNAA